MVWPVWRYKKYHWPNFLKSFVFNERIMEELCISLKSVSKKSIYFLESSLKSEKLQFLKNLSFCFSWYIVYTQQNLYCTLHWQFNWPTIYLLALLGEFKWKPFSLQTPISWTTNKSLMKIISLVDNFFSLFLL